MELLFVTPGVELIIRLDGSENPVACNALLLQTALYTVGRGSIPGRVMPKTWKNDACYFPA